jgi:hypothetical protein
MSKRGFLSAEWRNIAILTYPAKPSILAPLLPNGLELDLWNGHAFISVVGLLFKHLSVLGIPLPLYQQFEQVNLRFYVRRLAGPDWRRGVVFVKEFVPSRLLASAARLLFYQDSQFAQMSRRFDNEIPEFGGQASGCSPADLQRPDMVSGAPLSGCLQNEQRPPTAVEYSWRYSGRRNRLGLTVKGPWCSPERESFEHFAAERNWGYVGAARGRTLELEVRRPAWRVAPADGWLDCDAARTYGDPFADLLSPEPACAFLAAGSAVILPYGFTLPSSNSHRR